MVIRGTKLPPLLPQAGSGSMATPASWTRSSATSPGALVPTGSQSLASQLSQGTVLTHPSLSLSLTSEQGLRPIPPQYLGAVRKWKNRARRSDADKRSVPSWPCLCLAASLTEQMAVVDGPSICLNSELRAGGRKKGLPTQVKSTRYI